VSIFAHGAHATLSGLDTGKYKPTALKWVRNRKSQFGSNSSHAKLPVRQHASSSSFFPVRPQSLQVFMRERMAGRLCAMHALCVLFGLRCSVNLTPPLSGCSGRGSWDLNLICSPELD
jgi:hypothetical protein